MVSYTSLRVLLILVIFASCALCQNIKSCVQTDSCTCKTADNKVVSLSPLAKSSGDPALSDETSGTAYYYNPCLNLDFHSINSGVFQSSATYWYNLGSNDGAVMTVANGYINIFLTGTVNIDKKVRHSNIKLICDQSAQGTLKYINELPQLTYNMELTTKYACPSQPPPPRTSTTPGHHRGGGSSPLSVGSYLTIGCFMAGNFHETAVAPQELKFFVLLVLYIIVGVLVQIFVKKAEGRERIPNSSFWFSLPGFIWDGTKFTFSCGRGSYQRI